MNGKLTLLIMFFLINNFSYSQMFIIKSQIKTDDNGCSNNILKNITLQIKDANTFQNITAFKQRKCTEYYKSPKILGHFRASISADGYETKFIDFQINEEVKDTLDLGEIILIKSESIELSSLTITGIKKEFIKVEADKTTISIVENDILSSSSIYDAIMKLPGILISPNGDINMNGKSSSIYIDGIPSNLSSQDLISFLQGLPANVVEKIEIITSPGASYEANTSGGILNIITNKKGIKGLSGTLNLNYGINKNNKITPSLVINGRRKKINFQLITGFNYWENEKNNYSLREFTSFNPSQFYEQKKSLNGKSNFIYIKPSINLKLNDKMNLILNYQFSKQNNNDNTQSLYKSINNIPLINSTNDSKIAKSNNNQEFVLKYQYKIDSLNRNLDLTLYYSNFSRLQFNNSLQNVNSEKFYNETKLSLNLENIYTKYDFSYPIPLLDLSLSTGGKIQHIKANSNGKYNINNKDYALFLSPQYNSELNFAYFENNFALYFEVKKKINKLFLNAGLRWENNTQKSNEYLNYPSLERKYSNIFPNINLLYKVTPFINFISSYSKKISLPAYGDLDPNITGYYDSFNSTVGNPNLSPNYYNNFEMKFSVYDYLQLSVNYSSSSNINLLVFEANQNSNSSIQTFKSFNNVNNLSLNLSVPIPFSLFKEGISFFKKNNLNIDKLDFLYIYGSYNRFKVEEYSENTKPIWAIGGFMQINILKDLKFSFNYNYSSKGTYQIYNLIKPIHSGDLSLNKSFINKSLTVSLSLSDIFKSKNTNAKIDFENLNINYNQRYDSRVLWLRASYNFGRFGFLKKENSTIRVDKLNLESSKDISTEINTKQKSI